MLYEYQNIIVGQTNIHKCIMIDICLVSVKNRFNKSGTRQIKKLSSHLNYFFRLNVYVQRLLKDRVIALHCSGVDL